jgi:hypothetical protein
MVPEVKRVQTGLLGADFEVAAYNRYRFARVYNGENGIRNCARTLTPAGSETSKPANTCSR